MSPIEAPSIAMYCDWPNAPLWVEELKKVGVRMQVWPGIQDAAAVKFVLCWKPPGGFLQQFPNLVAVQSMGAGVDSFFNTSDQLPQNVKLLRIVDPYMAESMATWALWGVINVQRKFDDYWKAQQACRWDKGIENYKNKENKDMRVGVMGLGVMGGAVADTLLRNGYTLSAWTRSKREREGVKCYSGQEELRNFVSCCDVLICMLPLTQQTRGIVNADLLSWLPAGAAFINGARGAHVVEGHLIAALDSGQLSSALLDVFEVEPLPTDSPLWKHPKVRITPHVASVTNIQTAVDQIVSNYHSVLSGTELPADALVNFSAGY